MAAQKPLANVTACKSNEQCSSENCVDNFCCDTACYEGCKACSAAKKGNGADGVCGLIANDLDPDEECFGGSCDGRGTCKAYNGVECTANAQCLSNFCVDGYCCNNLCNGLCQACSFAKKGSGYNGNCGSIAATKDPDNECNPGECTGSGTCNQPQTPQANGSACASATQCLSGLCTDGVCCDSACNSPCMACSTAKKGSGTNGVCGYISAERDPDNECNGGVCDGAGVCKFYNGASCTQTSQCLSNFCVDGRCCGNICMGNCQACSAAKKGGGSDGICGNIATNTDPDEECANSECNGSGACTATQWLAIDGEACVSGAQCLSGYCADGVCCNSWCLGSCQACTAAKKGEGLDGTCGPIKYDTDPDDECWGGSCSGKGSCRQYNGLPCSSSTQCLSNYCVDGVCCNNGCKQSCQACSAAKKGQGSDGVCGSILSGKDPDNECSPGECNGSGGCTAAQTKQANGVACTHSAQCLSGFCADGVCCDNGCAGVCDACTTAKKGGGANGTCGPISNNTDPDDECWNGACNGAFACKFSNGTTCSAASECASGSCVDRYCCNNACSGGCQACDASPSAGTCTTTGTCSGPCTGTLGLPNAPVATGGFDTYPFVGIAATSLVVGDFNGDRKPDISASYTDPGGIWLNQGDGTFGSQILSKRSFTGNTNTYAMLDLNRNGYLEPLELAGTNGAADFNGDGRVDFVGLGIIPGTPPGSGPDAGTPHKYYVGVSIDDGTGHYVQIGNYPAGESYSGQPPFPVGSPNVASADFNGDGKLDVAVCSYNFVWLGINQGNAVFSASTIISANTGDNDWPSSVATGDINGDGKPDLLIPWTKSPYGADHPLFTSIYLGTGNGGFSAPVQLPEVYRHARLADMTGDGKPDIVQPIDGTPKIAVEQNLGNLTFAPPALYPSGDVSINMEIVDIDNDEKLDIVNLGSGAVYVLRNRCLP